MAQVLDGNTAAATVAYALSEAAAIYPITPSSGMAEHVAQWATAGRLNIWNQPVTVTEMQSEIGVAGVLHGLSQAGVLATSFTSSQGLLLMKPELYKLAGEFLPVVVHVAARSVATGNLNVFGDHSDVMSVRDTGALILCAGSVQQSALFAAVAHLAAMATHLPAVHFFDGFDTSHTVRKVTLPTTADLANLVDSATHAAIRRRGLNNLQPTVRGGVQAPASWFELQEATNTAYADAPAVIERELARLNPLFATDCGLLDYTGSANASVVMITMGVIGNTARQVVEAANRAGLAWGVLEVHLYRPFPTAALLAQLPATTTHVVVLERTKAKGAVMEPLAEDVSAALLQAHRPIMLVHGRYGLGGKDTGPDAIKAAFVHATKPHAQAGFTLGIDDPVTHLSLPGIGQNDLTPPDTYAVKVLGKGYDGAVSGSRHTLAIIGEHTALDVQGRFVFDARRSNNLTVSQLRIAPQPITAAYDLRRFDLLLCYCDRYLARPDVLAGLADHGTVILNTAASPETLAALIAPATRAYLRTHHIQLFALDATLIASASGIAPHINGAMQAAFFKRTDFLPLPEAIAALKAKFAAEFAAHPELVAGNQHAIDQALQYLHPLVLPEAPLPAAPAAPQPTGDPFIDKIYRPLQAQQPLSVRDVLAAGMQNGAMPLGSAARDKPGLALQLPVWRPEQCIQCNRCVTVCPHAALRPVLVKNGVAVPFDTITARDFPDLQFRIQVSPDDCTGCTVCVDACPVKHKALVMAPMGKHRDDEAINWHIAARKRETVPVTPMQERSVRRVQYNQPLVAFSGACGGCGETAYLKLLTQMFPHNLAIANATGCSSIWGSSAPSIPWMTNPDGSGPVWASSLFEDNAEYGLGMQLGLQTIRAHLAASLRQVAATPHYSQHLRQCAQAWLDAGGRIDAEPAAAAALTTALLNEQAPALRPLVEQRQYFLKRTQWIVGGDGWAYDINTSGIDRILSRGDDVNILILDNEGYANTGGQSSTATPKAARNKFANDGQQHAKKDLPAIFMTYPHVYVAQVCIGADPEQTFKAFKEAAAFPGPAVIFAYSPCILHGLMHHSSLIEEQTAVTSGYWTLFRRPPATGEQAAAVHLDSRPPDWAQYPAFLAGERRFTRAETALAANQEDAKRRFARLHEPPQ